MIWSGMLPSPIKVNELRSTGDEGVTSMTLDRATFRRACDPSKTLVFSNPEDKKFYIDFASVRGNEIIEELKGTILDFFDVPTVCAVYGAYWLW